MIKTAGVDLRRGQFITYSNSRTRDGLWVANGVFEAMAQTAGDLNRGEAVRRMLDASTEGVPTPDLRRGPSPFAPILASVGLRTFAGYSRGTRHVDVEQEDVRLVVTPSRNGGAEEGYVGMSRQSVVLLGPEPEALGAAVRSAIAKWT